MHLYLSIGGLAINLAAALILAVADVWFSRSLLLHLDAQEANVSKLVQVLQSGGSGFVDTGVDLKRDRGENRARFLKLVGWGLLALGFLLNLAGLSHFYWG